MLCTPLRVLLVVLQFAGGTALLVGRPAHRLAAHRLARGTTCMAGGFFEAIAQDPFGMLKNNLQQMTDQRVARISHVMLRTDPAALSQRTKGQCYELLTSWKEV